MSTSRRTFLITSGVAAAGTAAAAGAAPASAAPQRSGRAPAALSSSDPFVAYVSDVASGQITVMRGDDEVVVTDHDLARRIAGAVS